MKLSDLKVGDSARVTCINLDYKSKRRLEDLGLSVGVVVKKIRNAPFLSPVEIKVMDFFLSIRKSIAKNVMVVKVYEN